MSELPKGKLVIIGGAEDKESQRSEMRDKNEEFERFEILKQLLRAAKDETIEIITTGSRIPREMEKMYESAFQEIGYEKPRFMNIQDNKDAKENNYLNRVKEAGLIFFTGGVQERLVDILGDTKIIDMIKKRYEEDKDFTVAGTSAGAMIMSHIMITEGGVNEAIVADDLKTSKGLGLVDNCIIDTHFIKRSRFGRLCNAVAKNPQLLGIGLGEDTALIIKNGFEAECAGSGMVILIDGSHIGKTNIQLANEGEPIYIEKLKVDLIVKGCKYSLKKRELLQV